MRLLYPEGQLRHSAVPPPESQVTASTLFSYIRHCTLGPFRKRKQHDTVIEKLPYTQQCNFEFYRASIYTVVIATLCSHNNGGAYPIVAYPAIRIACALHIEQTSEVHRCLCFFFSPPKPRIDTQKEELWCKDLLTMLTVVSC